MHTVNSAPTVGSQVKQLLPCALSSLPGSTSIYSSVPVNRDVRGGCGEGKTTIPWFPLYLMLKFYPDSRSSRPVLSHLALWSREHSNTFPSSSAPQEGCHHNLQLLLGESKQFAGGGKERRQGGNAGGVVLSPPTSPTLVFWAGDQSFCLTLIPDQASTNGPFAREAKPGSLDPASCFGCLLPAPAHFMKIIGKERKGSGFVYNAINI